VRILVAGDWHSELHEASVYLAFRTLGHDVSRFSWHEYFHTGNGWGRALEDIAKRAQNKFVLGPLLTHINRDFVSCVDSLRPDMVFVYRGTHITAESLRTVKARHPSCILVGYNNDDPFAPAHPRWLWRHFLLAVPAYDLILAYRHANLAHFRSAGARRVELLRSWFVPERNHPVELSEAERVQFESDVVFVGHYEPDNRVAFLEEIVRQGFLLKLFGPEWYPAARRSPELRSLGPVKFVSSVEYNQAMAGTKVALCFLSKLNRDTYTRRCFEIPATRTMMLSEYSRDLAGLFQEGVEAEYFRSRDEMLDKLRHYTANETQRRVIAEAGYRRVYADGHDVVSRMRQVNDWVNALRQAV
jgi:spore maturation protein CgeB